MCSILMWNRWPLTFTTAHSSLGTNGSGSSENSRGIGVTVLVIVGLESFVLDDTDEYLCLDDAEQHFILFLFVLV